MDFVFIIVQRYFDAFGRSNFFFIYFSFICNLYHTIPTRFPLFDILAGWQTIDLYDLIEVNRLNRHRVQESQIKKKNNKKTNNNTK